MHRWAGTGGVEIAGDSWGDPGGPPVVLLHGGGQTRHAWKNTGARLAERGYHPVALDARGHGDSGWALDGDYGRPAMVDDLVAVLGSIGATRPVLVGASMGGDTALLAVGEGRIDAGALVLVDTAPTLDRGGVDVIRSFMDRPEGFASLDEAAEAIQRYQPHRPRRGRREGLAKNLRQGPDGRYYWHWDPGFHAESVDLDARTRHLRSCARKVQVPTLLVRGAMSEVLTREAVAEFLALCPQAEHVDVADAAHMLVGDRNDVFADAMIAFLDRVAPSRSTRRAM